MNTRWVLGIISGSIIGWTCIMAFEASWEPNNTPLPSLSKGIESHSIATLSIGASATQSFTIRVASGLGRYMIRQGEYEGREGEMAPYTIRLVPIGEPPLSHYSPMLGQWVNLDTPVEWELNPTGAGEGQPLKYDIMLSSPANQSLFRGQFKANMTINIAEKI